MEKKKKNDKEIVPRFMNIYTKYNQKINDCMVEYVCNSDQQSLFLRQLGIVNVEIFI